MKRRTSLGWGVFWAATNAFCVGYNLAKGQSIGVIVCCLALALTCWTIVMGAWDDE